MNIKQRVFEVIGTAKGKDKASKVFDILIIILIVLSVVSVIISSYSNLSKELLLILRVFEIVSVIIFTIEYVLRLWTCKYLYPNSKIPILRYIFSFMAIIDLAAILPFYLPMIISVDLRFLRILRLFRIMRVFKLNRYSSAMETIGKVLKNEKEKLFYTIFIMGILIIFASSLMYYVENPAQPDKFPNIVASIWWAVATLTTVGYGDVYPITGLGKFLSGIIAILGIGIVALPTGIISSGFMSEMNSKNKKKRICPHCGKLIDD